MLSRDVIKICVWTRDMTSKVTLARWTQSSGPLCLWQCLCYKSREWKIHIQWNERRLKWISDRGFGLVTRQNTTQQLFWQTAEYQRCTYYLSCDSSTWIGRLSIATGGFTLTLRMTWARLALVPSAITVNLAFLYVVVKNAPGEVFVQHLEI